MTTILSICKQCIKDNKTDNRKYLGCDECYLDEPECSYCDNPAIYQCDDSRCKNLMCEDEDHAFECTYVCDKIYCRDCENMATNFCDCRDT